MATRIIKEFPMYSINNYGVVTNIETGQILKCQNRNGYNSVRLYNNGVEKRINVCRLVAEAFLDNKDNLPQINHKDENKHNDFVFVNPDGSVDPSKSNLEWCTSKHNCNWGTRNRKIGAAHRKPILCITNQTIYESVKKCAESLGLIPECVASAARLNKTLHNYKFAYVSND